MQDFEKKSQEVEHDYESGAMKSVIQGSLGEKNTPFVDEFQKPAISEEQRKIID